MFITLLFGVVLCYALILLARRVHHLLKLEDVSFSYKRDIFGWYFLDFLVILGMFGAILYDHFQILLLFCFILIALTFVIPRAIGRLLLEAIQEAKESTPEV